MVSIPELRSNLYTAPAYLFADAMFYGILDQCLQHHGRYRLVQGIFVNIVFYSQPVFKTDMFQRQVIFYNIEFFLKRNGFQFFRLHTATQDIAQFRNGRARPVWVFINQSAYAVEGVKNKMGIDMRFDCFQLKLFYQRFQFQRIKLLLPAFFDVMIEIIDQRPRDDRQTPFSIV